MCCPCMQARTFLEQQRREICKFRRILTRYPPPIRYQSPQYAKKYKLSIHYILLLPGTSCTCKSRAPSPPAPSRCPGSPRPGRSSAEGGRRTQHCESGGSWNCCCCCCWSRWLPLLLLLRFRLLRSSSLR